MASDVAYPDEDGSGWNLELRWSDWLAELANDEGDEMGKVADKGKRELDNRFDAVGWGLLFLLFGVVALPNGTAQYAAAVAVGAAMLGLNVLRTVAVVPVRWFSVILGGAFLIGGCGALVGVHMDVVVLFFVLAGIVSIAGAAIGPRHAVAE